MARNTEKRENEKYALQDLDYGEKPEKCGKCDTNTFDLEYGEKHSKMWKMKNAHCRTLSMVRKLKIMKNEKNTLLDMNMARNTEKGRK